MQITRHYLTIGNRRVHYRKCGSGPVVLMVHQSPRSSAEYGALMQEWGKNFTCIAPDTPGFGQSVPLAVAEPDINDFADAIAEFVTALGVGPVPAYGFHSGAIILITALRRHPGLFRAIAAGGYGVWTDEERAAFGANYTPPFLPLPYGEHLVWGWNRVLEQSWFFPWYDARPETRLANANDDPLAVEPIMREILDAGDAFRFGYAAVLKAPRDIPPPDAVTVPVLITAYDGDPMQAHIDRLGAMPASWSAQKVRTPQDQQDMSRDFLSAYVGDAVSAVPEDSDRGFVAVSVPGFDGVIHWRGKRDSDTLTLPAPGSEADLVEAGETLVIDPPGHGLSSNWSGAAPTDWASWKAVVEQFGASQITFPTLEKGDPDRLFPTLTPDRFGAYLIQAWAIIRARHFFSPWYETKAANALPFDPADITPDKLALRHRALIRATAAKAWHLALSNR